MKNAFGRSYVAIWVCALTVSDFLNKAMARSWHTHDTGVSSPDECTSSQEVPPDAMKNRMNSSRSGTHAERASRV
jgi:hypothetical protein